MTGGMEDKEGQRANQQRSILAVEAVLGGSGYPDHPPAIT